MQIESLTLRGFRNYDEVTVAPCAGINLFVGDNAHGKTNLVEGIYYLAAGKSFRTHKEAELVGLGREFAELSADVFTEERTKNLRAVLFASRRPRQLFFSGIKQKTFGAFAGNLTAVLFCPDDLSVLRGGAAARRRMIDLALCQLRVGYDNALSEYTRLCEQKSRILRDREQYPSLLDALPEFSEGMCRYGARILSVRARYLRALGEQAAAFHSEFSGGGETLRLEYHTVSSVDDPFADEAVIYDRLKSHMESHRIAELEAGQCLSGVHRDDFELFLGDLPLKSFGSQGQTRTAAISLKLAERELFCRDTGQMPVLLLDDVLSELDAKRQDYLLNKLQRGQIFITCCEPDRLTTVGKTFTVQNGTVTEKE